jgi:hypothetical protein
MNDQRRVIRIITACTGVKARTASSPLSAAELDQRRAPDTASLVRAEALYRGQQHLRLMRGVRAVRSNNDFDVDLWILSAGYGLVPADTLLAPYDCTFADMTRAQARERARYLVIPQQMRTLLVEPSALTLLLLGEEYLAACDLDVHVRVGAPTLVLCGRSTAIRLPPLEQFHTLELGPAEARAFSCGLIGLKGEVARRLLESIARDPGFLAHATEPGLRDLLLAPAHQQLAVSV